MSLVHEIPENDGRAESDTTNLVPDSFVLVPDPIPDST